MRVRVCTRSCVPFREYYVYTHTHIHTYIHTCKHTQRRTNKSQNKLIARTSSRNEKRRRANQLGAGLSSSIGLSAQTVLSMLTQRVDF